MNYSIDDLLKSPFEKIKRISEEIGLEENKVYKWLWDQKNKEHKNAKFVINK